MMNGELGAVCREGCGETFRAGGEVADLIKADLVLAEVDGKGLLDLAGLPEIEEAEGFFVVVDGNLPDATRAGFGEGEADF